VLALVSGSGCVLSPSRATYEVDTDGRDIRLGIGVIGESQKKARLSDTGITDEEELEEVVVSIA